MLTTFNVDEYVFGALEAGASGFLLKDTPVEQICGAVRIVYEGHALLYECGLIEPGENASSSEPVGPADPGSG